MDKREWLEPLGLGFDVHVPSIAEQQSWIPNCSERLSQPNVERVAMRDDTLLVQGISVFINFLDLSLA